MTALELARELLRSALQLGSRADTLTMDTPLMGGFPEFNSLTVVGLVAGIEENLGCEVSDTEISEDVFRTVGTLAEFIQSKMS
jgi:acyl carrier protein